MKKPKSLFLGTALKKSKLIRALTKKGPKLGTVVKRRLMAARKEIRRTQQIAKLQARIAKNPAAAGKLKKRLRALQHPTKRGHAWVFARKVVIPARPMVPEGRWPDLWSKAFDAVANEVVTKIMWSGVNRG